MIHGLLLPAWYAECGLGAGRSLPNFLPSQLHLSSTSSLLTSSNSLNLITPSLRCLYLHCLMHYSLALDSASSTFFQNFPQEPPTREAVESKASFNPLHMAKLTFNQVPARQITHSTLPPFSTSSHTLSPQPLPSSSTLPHSLSITLDCKTACSKFLSLSRTDVLYSIVRLTWQRSAVKWRVVYKSDRPWPIESKRFCILKGAMQKILCEQAVLSERQFSAACTPKDSAGWAWVGFQWEPIFSESERFWVFRGSSVECEQFPFN
jgi:hypothetical protein